LKRLETAARRLFTVAGDSPAPPSLIRTTLPALALDLCWLAMKDSTSLGMTSDGSILTNPKKTYRSWA
jgi:hypothetical protein